MIIIAEKWFQLGNRLFTMGHFMGAALAGGFTIANPAFADYAEHFETTKRDLWCRFPPRPSWFARARWLARATERPAVLLAHGMQKWHLNNRLFRAVTVGLDAEFSLEREDFQRWAKRTCFLLAHGWSFRDPVNFERYGSEIRTYFTPLAEYRTRIEQAITEARRQCEVLVGVHIRQGDYQAHLQGKYYYETARYRRLMEQVVELFPGRKVGFWICSNVPQDPMEFTNLQWFPGLGQLVQDLYSLAKCDYIVGPPSTFSQWASFYGQKPLCIVRDPQQPISAGSFVVFNAHMSHV